MERKIREIWFDLPRFLDGAAMNRLPFLSRAGGLPAGDDPGSQAMNLRAPQRAEEALEYLYRDPFANANLIGAIERRSRGRGSLEVRMVEDGTVRGVLVVVPGPDGSRCAGLDADDLATAELLLQALRPKERLQFALHRPQAVTVLHRLYVTAAAGVMLAFRCNGPWLQPRNPSPARLLTRADERAVRQCRDEAFSFSFHQAIRGGTPRDQSEVRAFGVVEGEQVLARCLTTWAAEGIERQIGTVWSVFTEPGARGRGLGRAVVAAATAAILDSGRVARYFAFSDNLPSLRICRSLGYLDDHAVHYFWGQQRQRGSSQ